MSLGLKVTRLFIAVKADSDWVIPSTRRNRSAVMRALITESLATGPTVVFGELDAEFLPAVVAVQDFMVWYPVCRSSSIFYQTYGGSGRGRSFVKISIRRTPPYLLCWRWKSSHTASHNTAIMGNKIYWHYLSVTDGQNSLMGNSTPPQRNRLSFLKLWHLPLLALFQKLRQLLFPNFSFNCGQQNSHPAKHSETSMLYKLRKIFTLSFLESANGQPTQLMVGHTVGKITVMIQAVSRRKFQQQKIQMKGVWWHTWTATQHMKEQQTLTVLRSSLRITLLTTFPSLQACTAQFSAPPAEVPNDNSFHEHTWRHSASLE